jgi:hypothetical protein
MKILESTQEHDALSQPSSSRLKCWRWFRLISERDPALCFTKAVADYDSLHRNLKLDFNNGKPNNAVEHLVSAIKPATIKALIESKLEMDKSNLKKESLEFVAYLEKMAIIHDTLSCGRSYENGQLWNK